MDSLSQIVLGAAVGQVVVGKEAGNKALLWGAIAGTIPDLDILPGLFMDTVSRMEIHRGFSHSFLFAIIAAPLLGWVVNSVHKQLNIGWKKWAWLFFWGIVTHFMLDNFTNWGTQIFYPANYRVAWRSIFVIDPLYTLPFLTFLLIVIFSRDPKFRHKMNWLGIGISLFYLMITVVNKNIINHTFESQLEQQNIQYLRYSSYPTPFNALLWGVNVETKNGFYIGFHSLLDDSDSVAFNFHPKNHFLLTDYKENDDLKRLLNLTKGWFIVGNTGGSLTVKDLRFGTATIPAYAGSPFNFTYHISVNGQNQIESIEREIIAFKDRSKVLTALWNRMLGKRLN